MSPLLLRTAVATTAVLATAGLATQLPASAATSTRHVTVTDRGYSPTKLTAPVGSKVVWAFKGNRGHNVTVDTGPTSFASPTKSSGTFSRTFRKRGTYLLYCSIHNFQMTLKVK
jgi:plastocyanin